MTRLKETLLHRQIHDRIVTLSEENILAHTLWFMRHHIDPQPYLLGDDWNNEEEER